MTEPNGRRIRGALLLDQGRNDLAEKELREHLSAEPDDAIGHALLSLALVELERFVEAEAEATSAITLDPGEAFGHYARARVLLARRRPKEAVASASETIRLDPDEPRGYQVLGGAYLGLRKWQEALAASDAGLAIAPEHETLLTIRGLALRQLGRAAESQTSFEGALRRDPSNSFAHASRGLGLLHEGKMAEALEAYREALRLDPTNEMAREGLVEALKARNPFYAGLLRAMLFLGRLSGRASFVLYIGFFLVQRTLRELVRRDPSLAPVVAPLVGLYLLFFWLTFAAGPLFNLLLRLDPLGRHALSSEQRLESDIVGPLVAVGAPAALLAIVTGSALPATIAITALGLVVPIAATFSCDAGWPRTVMALVTIVVALAGALGIAFALTGRTDLAFAFGIGTFVLVALSTWIAMPLARVTVRR